jgi:putative transport protein
MPHERACAPGRRQTSSSTGIIEFFRGQPVITLFLLLGFGYLVGRIKVAGLAFGPVAGTLLVSIALGQLGFRISAGAQAVGFALYIFSIGYQAGPRFLEILKSQGTRYFALALLVTTIGFIIAWVSGKLLSLPPGANAGLLAGGFTSSPMLAAAQEAVRSGLIALPRGWTAERLIASIGTSYAITYLVGTIGSIVIVSAFPKLIGLDLEAEARRLENAVNPDALEPLQARAYRVENEEFCRPTIGELTERLWDNLSTVRIRRDLAWLKPKASDHLQRGDEIYAYGYANFFRGGIDRAGPEIRILHETELSASWSHVVIVRHAAVGQTLRSLDLARRYGLVVTDVKRDSRALPVVRDLELKRGDILTVSGPVWGIKALPQTLGPIEANVIETDMTTFAFGIALGAALGLMSMTIAGIPISVGMAGGLLIVGAGAGWLNSMRPSIGRFPEAARWIFMEFGLLIFIAGVGLNAGGEVVETFRQAGPALLIAAAFVVSLPIVLGYVFCRKVLELEPVILLGALTGAMTSGPALGLLTRQANSSAPALGYTGTYALASIISTIAGTLILYV